VVPRVEDAVEAGLGQQHGLTARHLDVPRTRSVGEREGHACRSANQPDPGIRIETSSGPLGLHDRLDRAFGGPDHGPMLSRIGWRGDAAPSARQAETLSPGPASGTVERMASTLTERSERRSLGIAAVALTTVIWGLVPLVLRRIAMPTLAFASYRLWMGVLVYAAVFAVTGRRPSWRVLKICALGGVFFGADVFLSFTSFRLTSIANATIIAALAPVFITLGAARWFGERVQRRDVLFVASSFAGVVAVAVGSAGSPSWSPLGDLAALASVFSWTAYWLFSKRARASVGALEYMAHVMFVAAIMITALGFATGTDMAPPRGMDWVWVWVVTIFAGAVGHSFVAWSHHHVEAWLAALITQCQPVVATVAAWVVFGEVLTPIALAGAGVVLVSTAAILVRGALRRPDAPDDPTEIPAPGG
jgi:drug/metabolite transporter (DMT)-like permease